MKNAYDAADVCYCGVMVIGANSELVNIPAALLILNCVSWAHDLLADSTELAIAAQNLHSFDVANEELRVAHILKRWIEDDEQNIEAVPGLAYRAQFRPLAIRREGLAAYLHTVKRIGRRAKKSETPLYLFDNSWSDDEVCFYATDKLELALRHSGEIPAVQVTEEELRQRLEVVRAPWDQWR